MVLSSDASFLCFRASFCSSSHLRDKRLVNSVTTRNNSVLCDKIGALNVFALFFPVSCFVSIFDQAFVAAVWSNFFCYYVQLQSDTADNALLVRALDRFHRRLQAVQKLLPEVGVGR